MNLVDVIKQQLAGEVGKKLGNMAGIGESDMQKTIGAALPGLLSGLGAAASTKQGASKIADALGGMDTSMFGNLAGMLGSGAMQKGGGMLSGLLGGGIVDGLAAAIAKFTGINATMVKTVLGYLAPLVLGSVGSTFKGSKPSADGISRLFSEQKQNIASAMPAGLSLDTIPGFKALSSVGSAAASAAKAAPEAAKSGLGSMLVPILVLGAIVAGLAYFLTRPTAVQNAANSAASSASSMAQSATDAAADAVQGPTDAVQGPTDAVKGAVGDAVNAVAKALPNLPNVPNINLDELKTKFGGLMDKFSGDLGKITDAASADAALPGLKESLGKLDTLSTSLSSVPAAGKSIFSQLIKGQMDKLNPIIEKISALPGIGDAVKQVLTQIKEKLAALVG